ncbi:MAG: M24 family metallopeptidase, partial [Bacteroidota bacterium]
KTAEELREMEAAVNLSGAMHLAAMQATQIGLKEAAVMSVTQQVAVQADSRPAYGIICTVHGEVLHNEVYHHTLTEDRLLLLDAGGESPLYYAGDITRTWPVRGSFSQQQKEVYQIVESALRESAKKLAPGVSYREVHLMAAQILFAGLKELGLVKGDVEEAVQAGAHTLFFPHGLGHMIGLDVHDMEDLGEDRVGYDQTYQRDPRFGFRSLRLGRELEPGFALTVEPGIYFIPALIDAWQAEAKFADFINYEALVPYRNFGGIRLENDYHITAQGAELIGEPIPLSVKAVEAVLG